MPRGVPALNSFGGGELSPLLHARTDLDKYASGLRECRNFIVRAQGGATRRPGLRFVAATRANGAARLIPFEFSTVQAYVIEAGPFYFRFYKDGGQIEATPGVPYEIGSPYSAADLAGLRWAQSVDTLQLVHPNHVPRELARTGHTAWTLRLLGDAFFGPFPPDDRVDATLTVTGTVSPVTVSSTAAVFAATDVDRGIAFRRGTAWGFGRILTVTNPTTVQVQAFNIVNWPAGLPSDAFRLGEWNNGADGWPGAITYHQGRLFLGGTRSRPQTLWGSNSDNFSNFLVGFGVAADHPVRYTINDSQMNAIRWLSSGRDLLVGTASAEFVISAGNGQPLTPTNAEARRQTTEGGADVRAVQIGQGTVFVQRGGRRVNDVAYAFEADSYLSNDLTVLADHIARASIVDMAWQPEPWRVLWCVLGDGTLIGCTYMRDQRVIAWHRHALGGGGLVRSVACIPSVAASELWVVAERTIGGQLRRYVERLEPEFWSEGEAAKRAALFLDSGITYAGAPANSITGLAHLEGATVAVLADGAPHPDVVVSGGAVALQRSASTVSVGFGYHSRLETLDIEAGAADGAAATRRRHLAEVGIRVFQTVGGRFGYRDDQTGADVMERVEARLPAVPMGQSPPLFTGDLVMRVPARWSRACRIVAEQDQPLPFTLLGLVPRIQATE